MRDPRFSLPPVTGALNQNPNGEATTSLVQAICMSRLCRCFQLCSNGSEFLGSKFELTHYCRSIQTVLPLGAKRKTGTLERPHSVGKRDCGRECLRLSISCRHDDPTG